MVDITYKPLVLNFNYPKRVYCEGIIDNREGFKLLFSSDHQRWIRFWFNGSVAYRKIDEGDWLKTISKIQEPYEPVYEVFNSEFMQWFSDESYDVRKGIRNFLFLSSNYIIDVLDYELPKIEIL